MYANFYPFMTPKCKNRLSLYSLYDHQMTGSFIYSAWQCFFVQWLLENMFCANADTVIGFRCRIHTGPLYILSWKQVLTEKCSLVSQRKQLASILNRAKFVFQALFPLKFTTISKLSWPGVERSPCG